jgi:glycerophosphoryl diester phosphodiesterase
MACSPAHRLIVSIILSHRGNLVGPNDAAENRLPAIRAALDCGWGVETDIRRDADGRFYISHDAMPSAHETPAEDFFALFRAYRDATVALNIKELGDEEALVELLDHEDVASQTFLFDMELLEREAGHTARTFRNLHPTIRIAARISDRGESIDQALAIDVASVIWLDEFDGPCFTQTDIRRLREAGRAVFAVSPDLHGKSAADCRRRWLEFIRWGVDGICTDYPAALARVSRAVAPEAAA